MRIKDMLATGIAAAFVGMAFAMVGQHDDELRVIAKEHDNLKSHYDDLERRVSNIESDLNNVMNFCVHKAYDDMFSDQRSTN